MIEKHQHGMHRFPRKDRCPGLLQEVREQAVSATEVDLHILPGAKELPHGDREEALSRQIENYFVNLCRYHCYVFVFNET